MIVQIVVMVIQVIHAIVKKIVQVNVNLVQQLDQRIVILQMELLDVQFLMIVSLSEPMWC